MMINQNEMLRCTPEEAGIPSGAVVEFCEKLKEKGVPMHSVILARFGRVFVEGYYAPWDASMKHRMFSETKSFTSLAIGCLAEEGKLSLEDPIIEYFPEYTPAEPHPCLAELTIRQMLGMQTCHKTTTYKDDLTKNWVESFFITPPDHKPGTIFNYDTSSTHVLTALVEKLTGKRMLDYLRERCLNEIGFSEDAYVIPDPFGVSMGGSGLMARPMDMMRVGLLLMNHGCWNGKQLLPEDYIKEATSFKVPTLAKGPILEERQGYGYQFWRLSKNGFMLYGMGGQLVLCLPKYALVCVTTADTMRTSGGNQAIYDSLYETILPAIEGRKSFLEYTDKALAGYLSNLALETVKGAKTSGIAGLTEKINGRRYRILNGNALIDAVSFEFNEAAEEGSFHFYGSKGEGTIEFALRKNKVTNFPIYDQPCAASAGWLDDRNFYLMAEIMGEDIGGFWMQASFGDDDSVTLFMNRTIEYCTGELTGFMSGVWDKKC